MRLLTILGIVLVAAAPAAADGVPPVPLVLYPTAAPSPALKDALLPELRDTIPGNAVGHYRRAVQTMKQDLPAQQEWGVVVDKWMALPLKDLPREDVGKFLKPCETTLAEVEAGARSEDCDWGLTEKLRKMGVSALLPDVQEMRTIANLLQLRARYEMAEGRPDKAIRTIRTGFAVARHVAHQPTLICALVGIAVASLMENRLEELVQQPDAPNLYWSLADLPRPFIDLREPMQGERVMAYGCFPGLAEMAVDLNAKPMAPEQITKMLDVHTLGQELDLSPPESAAGLAAGFVVAGRLLARHEAAKKRLIAQGRPKELVDAMPHLQVALLDAMLQYDELFDESAKWQNLPFREALPGMKQAGSRADAALSDKSGPALPLVRLLLPAVVKVVSARTRVDRRIAALRCVEAVRLFAADHDGKLPASLDEIKDPPIPPDPVTGKPFDYRLVRGVAILGCSPFPGVQADHANTPTYELRIGR